MNGRKKLVNKIVFSAALAAVYAALTIAIAPFGYGPLQLRVSEALCVLPFFFPFSAWGLAIGCLIANIMSPFGLIDIIFGTAATAIAALLTIRIGKISRRSLAAKIAACLPPVVVNGIVVGAVLSFSSTPDTFLEGIWLYGSQVAIGEALSVFALGLPILILLPNSKIMRALNDIYNNHTEE